MMANGQFRFGIMEAIGGYYSTRILYWLNGHGVLDDVMNGHSVSQIATDRGWSATSLQMLLDYVAKTTRVLEFTHASELTVAPEFRTYQQCGHHLDKYVGAFGPGLEHLDDLVKPAGRSKRFVNEERLASAFERASERPDAVIMDILVTAGVQYLLDLGCGPAAMLCQMAADAPPFHGIGVDASEEMCGRASARVFKAGVQDQVAIRHGNVWSLRDIIEETERREIDAVYASSLFNELFDYDNPTAVQLLKLLGELFPGRKLFVVDYYGKLGQSLPVNGSYVHSLLQDVVQVMTGQGVPPPSLEAWYEVYEAAGCQLCKVYSGHAAGLDWFIHVVEL